MKNLPDRDPRDEGFFHAGGALAWALVLGLPLLFGGGVWLAFNNQHARFRLEMTQVAYGDNVELMERARQEAGAGRDSLDQIRAMAADSAAETPFIVISVADNRLWYKRGNQVLFTTRVATGTGKNLETGKGGKRWKFETPRGRLVVERKDIEPAWVPPDWHYIEVAKKKGLRIASIERGKTIPAGNGAVIAVSGNNVVTRTSDGQEVPIEVREGNEIIVGKSLVIPPYEVNQRKYFGTLGVNRLYLGDGYGIHGTDAPTSIGRNASHGCVRVRNEDAELLFRIVPVGTVVYIY